VLAVILFAAAAQRLVYLQELRATPYYCAPLIDSWEYHRDALLILRFGNASNGPFWHPPLYTYLLSQIYRAAGSGPLAPRLVNFVFALVSAGVLYRFARRLTTTAGALVATAIFVLMPLNLFFEGQLLPVQLGIFLMIVMLSITAIALDNGKPWTWLTAGVLFGLAALTLPTVVLFGIAMIPWLFSMLNRRQAIAGAFLFAAGAAVAIAPVTARNWRMTREFVLISTNGGVNFFLGNNVRSDQLVQLRPGSEWEGLIRLAGNRGDAEASRFFFRMGLEFIWREPGNAAVLYAKKAYRLVNNLDLMRNQDIAYHRSLFWALRMPWLGFGWLTALAIVGWQLLGGVRRDRQLLALFITSYAVGVLLFFITARYRMPLVPFLAIPAGGLLAQFTQWLRKRQLRPAIVRAALVLPMFAVTSTNVVDDSRIHYRDVYMNLADAEERCGDANAARAALIKVTELAPEFPDAQLRLGTLALQEARLDEAVTRFQAVARLRPDSEKPFFNLGLAYLQQGDAAQAAATFQRTAEINPRDGDIAFHLGQALTRLDDPAADEWYATAAERFRAFLNIQPYAADGWRKLGVALLLRRDQTGAAAAFDRALHLSPSGTEAAAYAAEIALARGDLNRAEQVASLCLSRDPTSARCASVMGSVKLGRGRMNEALTMFQIAVEAEPGNGLNWNRLAVAQLAIGRPADASRCAREAAARGYRPDPTFLAELRRQGHPIE